MKIQICYCTLSYSHLPGMAVRINGKTIMESKFFFIFFSTVVYHRMLNHIPCAPQEDLAFFRGIAFSLPL